MFTRFLSGRRAGLDRATAILADLLTARGATGLATDWTAIDGIDPYGLFLAARHEGFIHGAVYCSEGTPASVMLAARRTRPFCRDEIVDFQDAMAALHAAFMPAPALSTPQRVALQLYANGLGQDAIAARLGISRSALKERLRGARRRLGACSTPQAACIALSHGEISLALETMQGQAAPYCALPGTAFRDGADDIISGPCAGPPRPA